MLVRAVVVHIRQVVAVDMLALGAFFIAVVQGILSRTLERGGRSMRVVAKTGFTV